MAHHSSTPAGDSLRQSMEIDAQRLKLGATGKMPLPPVSVDDEGEIQLAISHDSNRQKVYLNFGKQVIWIGFTPEQAVEIGGALIKHSRLVRGITD